MIFPLSTLAMSLVQAQFWLVVTTRHRPLPFRRLPPPSIVRRHADASHRTPRSRRLIAPSRLEDIGGHRILSSPLSCGSRWLIAPPRLGDAGGHRILSSE
ncbi:hypothetical protein GUJ93_ZPchr0015g6809 [Zizania palustris]|uniref:Secreted protein n=1 Tax=Zizania palustris TaxID=103762 RepID=A0A8J5W661_ZIZPA|nr:hypothetical protein GUJ93_ZPchr0015g6809 [Zizania palustris]